MRIADVVPAANPSRPPLPLSRSSLASMAMCASSLLGIGAAQAERNRPEQAGTAMMSVDCRRLTVTGIRPLLHESCRRICRTRRSRSAWCRASADDEQAVTRLEDALKNVPGITLNAGEGAARGDTVNLRGFSAFNDFFLDGIRDAAVYKRDSFDLQSVEVVKGPSADAVRARLDRRGDQPGQQGAIAGAARQRGGRRRQQRRGARHCRHRPAARPPPRGAAECDGRIFQRRRRSDFVRTGAGASPPAWHVRHRPARQSLTLAYLHLPETIVLTRACRS